MFKVTDRSHIQVMICTLSLQGKSSVYQNYHQEKYSPCFSHRYSFFSLKIVGKENFISTLVSRFFDNQPNLRKF